MYWTTKEGKRIHIESLKDSHLLNILKHIKRKAKEGITVYKGTPQWFDHEPCVWQETIYGDDVLDEMGYEELYEEAQKRKLIIK